MLFWVAAVDNRVRDETYFGSHSVSLRFPLTIVQMGPHDLGAAAKASKPGVSNVFQLWAGPPSLRPCGWPDHILKGGGE